MKRGHRIALAPLLGLALGLAGLATPAARADQIVLSFDAVPVGACWDSWIDQGCLLQFGTTTTGACAGPGVCSFTQDPGQVVITSQINALLQGISGVERVEVDIVEGATSGCGTVKILSGALPVGSAESTHAGPTPETLVAQAPAGYTVSAFQVSGEGTAVLEIRLIGASVTDISRRSWGTIKATYLSGD